MTEERKGMFAATAAYTIFGFSYLFSKMALDVTEPIILLCARFSLTFLILNLLVGCRAMKLNLRGKNLLGPIVIGILQPVLYFVFENYGLKYTTTSFTGMISSVSPVFSAILGAFLLREMPNGKQWISIAVSIAGVLMVSLGGSGGENTTLGCLCLVTAYLLGAFYSLLVRKMSEQFTPFELTYVMFTVGFVFFLAWAFLGYRGETIPMLATAFGSGKFIVSVLYLGGLSSVGAYLLSNYSLSKLPVARSTIFANFATVVSVLAGVIFMHDRFTWVSFVAFCLILGGIWGVNRFGTARESA